MYISLYEIVMNSNTIVIPKTVPVWSKSLTFTFMPTTSKCDYSYHPVHELRGTYGEYLCNKRRKVRESDQGDIVYDTTV